MLEIKNKFNDDRRTDIDMTALEYIEDESLIPQEDIIVMLSNLGYVKRMASNVYRTQNRGGVGVKGITTNEEDFAKMMISMNTHDSIMFFTNKGKVYRIKGYEIPEFSRHSKGLPILNLLQLEKDEKIMSVVNLNENEEKYRYLLFTTKNGSVKRTDISEFDSIRKSGKIALIIREDDELIKVDKTTGEQEVLIGSSSGKVVHCDENEIRSMGRKTAGVKGIDLDKDEKVIGCEVVDKNSSMNLLIVTKNGYGKKTKIDEFRLTHRGSKGVKTLNVTEKNGNLVSIRSVTGEEDLLLITDKGVIIRLSLEQISTLKRATQGVRLINLKENCTVATVATVAKVEDEDIEEESQESTEVKENE
jgi:DNA gyrase subunit A